MKYILICFALGVCLLGCSETPDDYDYYYQRIGGVSIDERMHIKEVLETNGYEDITFIWDFGETVTAKRRKGGRK